jgi:hypothetical protein
MVAVAVAVAVVVLMSVVVDAVGASRGLLASSDLSIG